MPRPHREEERREETIRAVWASVARYGAKGTTIDRVAGIAGFSKGVIHYYFDSKQDLLLAAFEAYLSAFEGETMTLLSALGREPSAKELLDAIVDASLSPFSASDLEAAELPLLGPGEPLGPRYKARLFVQFYSLAMSDLNFSRAAAQVYERMGEYCAQCFAALLPEAKKADSLSYAVGLMAMIDGLYLQRVLGYSPSGIPSHAALARRLLIEAARQA